MRSVTERLEELRQFDNLPLAERFSRAHPLRQKIAEYKTLGDTETAQIFYWEWLVLDDRGILEVHCLEPTPDRDVRRWAWLVALRSEAEAVDYFVSQVDQCSNPLHRALYCNFIWESLHDQGNRSAHQWGKRAARDLLAAAEYLADANWGMECVACLCRSVEISLTLNDREAICNWLEQWEGIVEHLNADEKRRWSLEVSEMILALNSSRMSDLIDDTTLRDLATIAEESLPYYENQELTHWGIARYCAELASKIHRALGEVRRAEELVLRKCQISEQQIDVMLSRTSPPSGASLASQEATNAIKEYQDAYSLLTESDLRAAANQKIQDLQVRVRDLNRQAADELPLISLPTGINIQESFEPVVEELFATNHTRWIDRLRETFAPPSLDQIERAVEEGPSSIFDFLSVRTSVGDRSLGFDGPDAFRCRQRYELVIKVFVYGLMYVFYSTRRLGVHLTSYLRREIEQKLPDREDIRYFFDATAHYWQNGECIAGLHLLAPLCERLFKAMVGRAGVSVLSGQQQGRQEEASLGKLLDPDLSPEVCQLLDPDLIHFLRYAWVDEPGGNLRNRVAHGWVQPEECFWYTMILLFWTVIQSLGIEPID